MRVLVTGGAGFIGSHVVDALIQRGEEVWVMDDLSGGSLSNVNHRAHNVSLDLRYPEATEEVIAEIRPDVVYHLASNAAENKSQYCPIDISTRNYNAFLNTLVGAIKSGTKRFLFVSSIAVYGAQEPPFSEQMLPHPEDIYGVTKYASEEALKILSKVHGVEYVIVRPHNVYGPRQNMRDPYRNVVTIFMNSILNNKPYYIYGDGKQIRQFSYIDDVVDSIMAAGYGQPNMTYNVGSDTPHTVKQLSDEIMKITEFDKEPILLPERENEVKEAIATHYEQERYLVGGDDTPLEHGLKQTWAWCRAMGPQEPVYTQMELPNEKLPENWK